MVDRRNTLDLVILDAPHFSMLQALMLEDGRRNEDEQVAWLIAKETTQRSAAQARREADHGGVGRRLT